MVNLDFNFGGVEGANSSFEPFEGTVEAKVEKFEVKDTKDKDGVKQTTSDGKQSQYVNTTYKVAEGETALDKDGKEIQVGGRLVWGINSIRFPDDPMDDTDKERTTREMFIGWLNTLSGTDFADHEGGIDFNAMIGAPVRLVCTIGSYDGKPSQNVKRVLAPEDDSPLDSLRTSL